MSAAAAAGSARGASAADAKPSVSRDVAGKENLNVVSLEKEVGLNRLELIHLGRWSIAQQSR